MTAIPALVGDSTLAATIATLKPLESVSETPQGCLIGIWTDTWLTYTAIAELLANRGDANPEVWETELRDLTEALRDLHRREGEKYAVATSLYVTETTGRRGPGKAVGVLA